MPIVLTPSVTSKFFPNTVFDKQIFTNIHIMYCIYSYFPSIEFWEKKLKTNVALPPNPAPHHNFCLSLTLLLILFLWTDSCMVNRAFSSKMTFIHVRTDQVLKERGKSLAASGWRWEKGELLWAFNPRAIVFPVSCLSFSHSIPGYRSRLLSSQRKVS